MHSFARRVIGAALLNAGVYEDVEADRGAGVQAAIVVLLSSTAAGLGSRGFGASRPLHVLLFAGIALVAWIAWAVVTLQLGSRILPAPSTSADMGQLLRTTAFASAPGMLQIFGLVPGIAAPLYAVTALWMLAAMTVAVRQALDYPTISRAITVCIIGWLLAVTMAVTAGVLFGPRLS